MAISHDVAAQKTLDQRRPYQRLWHGVHLHKRVGVMVVSLSAILGDQWVEDDGVSMAIPKTC